MQNYYFNIINTIAIEHAKYLLRDYGEIKNIHTIAQKKEFFKKSYYRNSISIQQKLILKNPGAGFYIGETLIKNSKNNQYIQINTIDDKQNFMNSIPLWFTQIVIFELKNPENTELKDNINILYAYFYMPNTDDLWSFEPKQGLYNNTKIHPIIEKEAAKKRIYGSDILMSLLVTVGKASTMEFSNSDPLTQELIKFIFDVSKIDYKTQDQKIQII